jgi:hypothetical protein
MQPWPGDPSEGGGRTPSGPRVVKVRAPVYTTRCATLQSMLQAIVDVGLTGRPAVLFLAHLSRETGYGQVVWNFNFGNVKQFAAGPWYRHPDANGDAYEAFAAADDGMARMLGVLQADRYRAAREQLLAGDRRWYGTLGRAGYYESHDFDAAQREYDGVLALVDACNLVVPSPSISMRNGLTAAAALGLFGTICWFLKGSGTL